MLTPNGKCVAILMGLWCALASTAQSASIQALSDTAGTNFLLTATAISADGSTVIGNNNAVGFRWTSSTKLVPMPYLPGSEGFSNPPTAVNADGSVIVGWDILAPNVTQVAYRWTNGTMFQLPPRVGGGTKTPTGVSGDGKTIVGGEGPAFRWKQTTGYTNLTGPADGQPVFTAATGISTDGTTIVGNVNFGQAYVLSPFISLAIPGQSSASGVSGNGQVVFGAMQAGGGNQAFLWTLDGGSQPLGDLPGGSVESKALAANVDGSVIVGYGNGDAGQRAMMWSAATGMVDLRTYFISIGISGLSSWTLTEATGISADGKTFIGNGSNGAGGSAWIVKVPEPSTYALAAVGMVALLAIKRRKSQA